MRKQNFNVNNLRVASPCSVGWETMSGDERARYCNSCKSNVYNVSAMMETEVKSLIGNREGRICVRLYKRADGTVLTKDCPVGFRAYQKRVARFAGAALATVLGLFSVSFGQKDDSKSVDASKVQIIKTASEKNILSGTVMDEFGAVIPNIEIKLYKNTNEKPLKTNSDDEGNYEFESVSAGIYMLEIQAPQGFKKYKAAKIEIKNGEKIQFNITLMLNGDVETVGLLATEEMIENSPSHLTDKITPRKIKKSPVKP